VRAQERLLERVLAVLAVADHVPAEREQRRVMAVVERLERGLVTRADERGETLVVEAPESARSGAALKCRFQHSQDAVPRSKFLTDR
jgi:hypothetical protein